MFDNIIHNAKGSLNMVIMFFVAGIVANVLMTLVDQGAFDPMTILMAGISAGVAGFATALVLGAAK